MGYPFSQEITAVAMKLSHEACTMNRKKVLFCSMFLMTICLRSEPRFV